MLNSDDPLKMLYRSEKPILEPEDEAESVGVVDNVVFPTALNARGAGRFDVYNGMADTRIGVVQIDLPYGFL